MKHKEIEKGKKKLWRVFFVFFVYKLLATKKVIFLNFFVFFFASFVVPLEKKKFRKFLTLKEIVFEKKLPVIYKRSICPEYKKYLQEYWQIVY